MSLCVVRCSSFVVCSAAVGVCCSLFVFVVRCSLFVDGCFSVVVVWCVLCAARL